MTEAARCSRVLCRLKEVPEETADTTAEAILEQQLAEAEVCRSCLVLCVRDVCGINPSKTGAVEVDV
jgi:hypothetical protein